MRINLILAPLIPVVALGFYAAINSANDEGLLKQKIYSVTLNGEKKVEKVKTLERPIITARNIANNLKYNLVKFYSYKVEDIDNHMDINEPLFNANFYNSLRAQTIAEVKALIDSEVRVVDFIITNGPLYMGSVYSETRNWEYYIEGYFTYHGNFSKHANQFKRVKLKVSMREAKTKNGNASGVEIYKIDQF